MFRNAIYTAGLILGAVSHVAHAQGVPPLRKVGYSCVATQGTTKGSFAYGFVFSAQWLPQFNDRSSQTYFFRAPSEVIVKIYQYETTGDAFPKFLSTSILTKQATDDESQATFLGYTTTNLLVSAVFFRNPGDLPAGSFSRINVSHGPRTVQGFCRLVDMV